MFASPLKKICINQVSLIILASVENTVECKLKTVNVCMFLSEAGSKLISSFPANGFCSRVIFKRLLGCKHPVARTVEGATNGTV